MNPVPSRCRPERKSRKRRAGQIWPPRADTCSSEMGAPRSGRPWVAACPRRRGQPDLSRRTGAPRRATAYPRRRGRSDPSRVGEEEETHGSPAIAGGQRRGGQATHRPEEAAPSARDVEPGRRKHAIHA